MLYFQYICSFYIYVPVIMSYYVLQVQTQPMPYIALAASIVITTARKRTYGYYIILLLQTTTTNYTYQYYEVYTTTTPSYLTIMI